MSLSIQRETQQAYAIRRHIEEEFDIPEATKKLNDLLHDGIQKIIDIVNDKPITDADIPLSVSLELIKIASIDSIQFCDEFKNTASKAACVFFRNRHVFHVRFIKKDLSIN